MTVEQHNRGLGELHGAMAALSLRWKLAELSRDVLQRLLHHYRYIAMSRRSGSVRHPPGSGG